MKTYTVTKEFIIKPQNIIMTVGSTLQKYDDTAIVIVHGATSISAFTFYSWVGSEVSLEFMSLTSQEVDPDIPGALTPIDLGTNFTTTEIVNKINSVVSYINAEA